MSKDFCFDIDYTTNDMTGQSFCSEVAWCVCLLCASVCVQAYNHQCGHADALGGILDDITGLLDSVRSRQATALGGLFGPLGRQEKRSVFEQGSCRASKGGGGKRISRFVGPVGGVLPTCDESIPGGGQMLRSAICSMSIV